MDSEYPLFDIKSIPDCVSSVNHFSNFFLFTPEIAQEIIDNYMYDKQRPVSIYRVNQFSEAMRAGNFAPVSTITFAVSSNSVRCIDGQHTLRALIKSDNTLSLPVLILNETEKNPRSKIHYLYSKIDRGKPRTLKDSLRSQGIPNAMGLSPTSTLRAAVATRVIVNKYSLLTPPQKMIQDEQIFETMKLYLLETQHCFRVLDGLEYANKLSGKIPLSILLTLYKEIDASSWSKIDDYIYGCATDDGLKKGDPRKIVYNSYTMYSRQGGGVLKSSCLANRN